MRGRPTICWKSDSGFGRYSSARSIVGQYEISQRTDSRNKITDFYRYAMQNAGIRVENGQLRIRRETLDRAVALGNELAGRIQMRDPEAQAAYSDMRRTLSGRYYLSPEDRRNIADFGAYNRNENMVRVTTDRRATSLDSAYSELRRSYPQYFSERATHPADQLQQINSVMRSLRHSTYSLSAADRRGVARELTNELVNSYVRTQRRRRGA